MGLLTVGAEVDKHLRETAKVPAIGSQLFLAETKMI